MLFHHKTNQIRSKDILSNKKLDDTKTVKFSSENHYFFLRITRILFKKVAKIYIIVMHTRCCRGKAGHKFKIFNNKPDRGKSVRKKK